MSNSRKLVLVSLLTAFGLLTFYNGVKAQPGVTGNPVTTSGCCSGVIRAVNGTQAAPSITFLGDLGTGFRLAAAADVRFGLSGNADQFRLTASNMFFRQPENIGWAVNTDPSSAAALWMNMPASGVFKLNGSGASVPVQVTAAQSAVPTCSSNCGTSPSVVGTDSFMTITMGASGAPASGFVITFLAAWAAAPACIAVSALSSMVVGKQPIAVQTATTTATVTTNGTAPGNSDKYFMHCAGMQ